MNIQQPQEYSRTSSRVLSGCLSKQLVIPDLNVVNDRLVYITVETLFVLPLYDPYVALARTFG